MADKMLVLDHQPQGSLQALADRLTDGTSVFACIQKRRHITQIGRPAFRDVWRKEKAKAIHLAMLVARPAERAFLATDLKLELLPSRTKKLE
jgi:hypothetical protein